MVAKILIVCLHYELSFFGIFHRFTNTIATKKTLSSLLKLLFQKIDGGMKSLSHCCVCEWVARVCYQIKAFGGNVWHVLFNTKKVFHRISHIIFKTKLIEGRWIFVGGA